MAFLDAEHRGEQPLPKKPARLAKVHVFLGAKRDSEHFYELKVDVETGEIVYKEQLLGRHPHVDGNDMVKTEKACLEDPRVQAAIKDMQLPEGAVVKIEPWTYATDGTNDMAQKITMVRAYDSLRDLFLPSTHHGLCAFAIVLLLYAPHQPPRCKPLRLPTGPLCRNVWSCRGTQDLLPTTWHVE